MKLAKGIICEGSGNSVNASTETFQCKHFWAWIFELYKTIGY